MLWLRVLCSILSFRSISGKVEKRSANVMIVRVSEFSPRGLRNRERIMSVRPM